MASIDPSPTLDGVTPVTNYRRRDAATQMIRHALLTGQLLPGQRVKEVDLAAVLNVSRPTAREAMGELIHEGTLVQIPYKGVRVAEVTIDDVLNVAEVRRGLETIAAQRIAAQADGHGLRILREAHERHLAALESGDEIAIDLTHLEFHRTLLEAADNPILLRIWPIVATKVQLVISKDNAFRHDIERDKTMHQRLVDTIAEGNLESIAEEVRRHIVDSAIEISERMRGKQGETAVSPA